MHENTKFSLSHIQGTEMQYANWKPWRKFFLAFLLSDQDCKLDCTTFQPFLGIAGWCIRPKYRN